MPNLQHNLHMEEAMIGSVGKYFISLFIALGVIFMLLCLYMSPPAWDVFAAIVLVVALTVVVKELLFR